MTARETPKRTLRGEEDARDIVNTLREFRRTGCNATQHAMALAIVDLRRALGELQAELLAMRARGAGA